MRVVLQRVREASVEVDHNIISRIGHGIVILLGIEEIDGPDDVDWLVRKISRMRIFEDDDGKMNRSLGDCGGEALVVSQFTLHASTKKGNRPSFIRAARPETAEPLYHRFCKALSQELETEVGRGKFGAMMRVSLIIDGPVTITMDSRQPE